MQWHEFDIVLPLLGWGLEASFSITVLAYVTGRDAHACDGGGRDDIARAKSDEFGA